MTDNIIDLRSRKPVALPPKSKAPVHAKPINESLVAMLKTLLEYAKAGDINGAIILAPLTDEMHWIEWFTDSIYEDCDSAIGRLERTKHWLTHAADEMDPAVQPLGPNEEPGS